MKKILGILIVFIALFTFNLNVNAANDKIDISEVKVIDKSSTITVDEPTIENNAINSSVKFNKVDDFVIYEVSLKNTDKYDYTIDKVLDNNTSDYLSVEYEYSDELKKNNSGTLKIKLTYKKQVLNQDKVSLDDLAITMNLIRSDGSKSSIKVTNPTTGDSIVRYVIIFILAISGLILTIKKVKVKNIKVGMFALILSVMILPFSIFAFEKFNIKITFTNIELIGEYEVYDIQIGDTTRQVTYGEEIGQLPEIPEKNGYESDGWVDSDGNEITEDTIVTKPLTLTPKYIAINYPITFNLGTDGTTTNDNTYTIEDEVTLTEPTREGYTFLGWTGFNGNTPEKNVTIPKGTTGPIELTANWRNDRERTVTFNPGDGQVSVESISVEIGETIDEFPTPTKSKYDFLGWYDGETKIEAPYTPTDNIELLAHYEETDIIKYTDKDGSGDLTIGDYVTMGNDGFWVIKNENGVVRLIAEYNLDSNSRQSKTNPRKVEFSYDAYWMINDCTATDGSGCDYRLNNDSYTYSSDQYGYYYVYKKYDNETNIAYSLENYERYLNSDVGVYGIYDMELLSYEEAVNLGCSEDSGSCPDYIANQDYWLGTMQDGDYLWIVDDSSTNLNSSDYDYVHGIRPVLTISENSIIRYVVTFDSQGGGYVPTLKVGKDEYLSTLPNDPVKDGYKFKGWYTDKTYTTKVTKKTRISDNVTFYAKWEKYYDISFDSKGGEEFDSIKVANNESIGRLPSAHKANMVLEGWYKDENYTERATSSTIVNGNMTVYAKWVTPTGITYTDSDNSDSINKGDTIIIGNDTFYVISEPNNGKVKALAQYNISANGRQDSSSTYFKSNFADVNYWYKNNNYIVDYDEGPGSGGIHYNVYRDKYDNDGDNNVKQYINKYKDYLVSLGSANIEDVRLLLMSEAAQLGCTHSYNSCPAFMGAQTFWLGSSYPAGSEQQGINIVVPSRDTYSPSIGGHFFDSNTNGIRPLVVLKLSDIEN